LTAEKPVAKHGEFIFVVLALGEPRLEDPRLEGGRQLPLGLYLIERL
jgi:hypothetical protein